MRLTIGQQGLALLLTGGLLALAQNAYARDTIAEFNFEGLKQPAELTKTYIKPVAMSGSTFGKAPELAPIKKKVAVTGFQVIFQEEVQEKVQGGLINGVRYGNFQPATWRLWVKGLSPATMQAITDAAYADLVSRLQQAGYDIVPTEVLMGQNTRYKALVEASFADGVASTGVPTQHKTDKLFQHETNIVVTPKTVPFFEVDGLFNLLGNQKRMKELGEVMKEQQGLSVVNAVYHLNTEKLTSIGNFGFVRSGAADETFGLSLTAGSQVTFIPFNEKNPRWNPGPYVSFSIKKPVESKSPVGQGRSLGENYGAQVLSGVLRVAGLPAPEVDRLRKYELYVDPAQYEALGTKLLGASNQLVVVSAQSSP